MNMPDEARARLSKDYASLEDEWQVLISLAQSDSELITLLKWIFLESPAYWETRARAGKVLLKENEEETWEIIEALVFSRDPDDNGTALTIFETLGDPRGVQLAQHWLTEETHPATQFEAITFLWDVYPEQVQQRLQALVGHPNENVRRRARKLLAEWGAG